MIKLKNLLLENQSHLVISIPKPNSQENAERRLNHQYAFGEVGIGQRFMLLHQTVSIFPILLKVNQSLGQVETLWLR